MLPEKVVIQGERNPKNPWRLIAAVDDEKLKIKESFHYIIAEEKSDLSMLLIAAVLNSKAANAWYSEHDLQFHVQNVLLEQLPFPNFSNAQRLKIEDKARQIAAIKQLWRAQGIPDQGTIFEVRRLLEEIDDIVFAAYDFSYEERLCIEKLMQRDRRPGVEWEDTLIPAPELQWLSANEELYHAAGEVIAVDYYANTITAELPGISRIPLRFPIPPALPGWSLRAGASFEAKIPARQVEEISELSERAVNRDVLDLARLDIYNVVPSRTAFLSDEQLLSYVATSIR